MWTEFLLTLAVLLSATGAFATELEPTVRGIVVTTPGLNLAEAKAYATAHDKLLLSDYLEISRPGEDHDRQLKSRFEKAQRAWLGGEMETARTEFRALTEMSLKADWRNAQREVLQTAYLRLAQAAESGTEREGWLESAARLYGDLTPNRSFYPPALLTDFEAARRRVSTTAVEIDLRDVFPDFTYVIVDGRKIDLALEGRTTLSAGTHRLTAYSDSHESVTEFLTSSQLRVFRLSPPQLTEGVCEKSQLRSRADLPSSLNVEIYSGENCPHDPAVLLQASRFISGGGGGSSATSQLEMPDAPVATSKKRTWLWIIGGALIAGAGYALATRHETSQPEPVHRSGF